MGEERFQDLEAAGTLTHSELGLTGGADDQVGELETQREVGRAEEEAIDDAVEFGEWSSLPLNPEEEAAHAVVYLTPAGVEDDHSVRVVVAEVELEAFGQKGEGRGVGVLGGLEELGIVDASYRRPEDGDETGDREGLDAFVDLIGHGRRDLPALDA